MIIFTDAINIEHRRSTETSSSYQWSTTIIYRMYNKTHKLIVVMGSLFSFCRLSRFKALHLFFNVFRTREREREEKRAVHELIHLLCTRYRARRLSEL